MKPLQAANDIKFDKLVLDRPAGTKLHPISDFLANLIKSAGGRKTVSGALGIFATGRETTCVGLDTDFKSHEAT